MLSTNLSRLGPNYPDYRARLAKRKSMFVHVVRDLRSRIACSTLTTASGYILLGCVGLFGFVNVHPVRIGAMDFSEGIEGMRVITSNGHKGVFLTGEPGLVFCVSYPTQCANKIQKL